MKDLRDRYLMLAREAAVPPVGLTVAWMTKIFRFGDVGGAAKCGLGEAPSAVGSSPSHAIMIAARGYSDDLPAMKGQARRARNGDVIVPTRVYPGTGPGRTLARICPARHPSHLYMRTIVAKICETNGYPSLYDIYPERNLPLHWDRMPTGGAWNAAMSNSSLPPDHALGREDGVRCLVGSLASYTRYTQKSVNCSPTARLVFRPLAG
jgi:hypothetical protein